MDTRLAGLMLTRDQAQPGLHGAPRVPDPKAPNQDARSVRAVRHRLSRPRGSELLRMRLGSVFHRLRLVKPEPARPAPAPQAPRVVGIRRRHASLEAPNHLLPRPEDCREHGPPPPPLLLCSFQFHVLRLRRQGPRGGRRRHIDSGQRRFVFGRCERRPARASWWHGGLSSIGWPGGLDSSAPSRVDGDGTARTRRRILG